MLELVVARIKLVSSQGVEHERIVRIRAVSDANLLFRCGHAETMLCEGPTRLDGNADVQAPAGGRRFTRKAEGEAAAEAYRSRRLAPATSPPFF